MFNLKIVPITGNCYIIALILHNQHKWSITCDEIDLEETISKVLRVSENLRKLPDSQPVPS